MSIRRYLLGRSIKKFLLEAFYWKGFYSTVSIGEFLFERFHWRAAWLKLLTHLQFSWKQSCDPFGEVSTSSQSRLSRSSEFVSRANSLPKKREKLQTGAC